MQDSERKNAEKERGNYKVILNSLREFISQILSTMHSTESLNIFNKPR